MAFRLNNSYSKIINPEQYNKLMSQQHLYIASSDNFICNIIKEKIVPTPLEVVELGCGPARVLSLLSYLDSINLTGIDIDQEFLSYGQTIIKHTRTKILYGDARTYKHVKPVDIFYSQGFHHHVPKGKPTHQYLRNVHQQLKENGCYILSDEFVPDYKSSSERKIYLVIWYSHIIAHALKHNFPFLAQEEAKTLLDDLHDGKKTKNFKTKEQINFILTRVAFKD